ncbi:uncharacterized protein [Eurosta solidaginis]|uniref:uncharacterized protein isoform X2 n=1 Tax=Eurosta solidaginis TaxID=178769 RepID=UPI003530BD79
MQARKGAGNLIIVKTRFPLNVQVPFAKKVKLTKLNLTGQEEQEQIPKILSCGHSRKNFSNKFMFLYMMAAVCIEGS